MNGTVEGEDVFIPIDWIIGGQENAGKGWRMLMECLGVGRGISLPALATAAGEMSYLTVGALQEFVNSSIFLSANLKVYKKQAVKLPAMPICLKHSVI